MVLEERHQTSYLLHRRMIGIIGLGLPIVLGVGGFLFEDVGLKTSISAFYHSPMGDIFVGSLCVIGVFLFAYRGYERKDDIAGDVGFACAILVALCPTEPAGATRFQEIVGAIHTVAAALLFSTMAYFALCLFTKTKEGSEDMTPGKRIRNRIYRTCGFSIIAAIVLIGLEYGLLPDASPIKRYQPVFWLESTAIVAFGIAWMIKGNTIMKDS